MESPEIVVITPYGELAFENTNTGDTMPIDTVLVIFGVPGFTHSDPEVIANFYQE